jgi:hypothetical protein
MLLGAALPANAADVYRASNEHGTVVRLLDEPCPTSTGWMKLKRAEMHYKGKLYAACWALVGNVVVVFDEAGDNSPYPTSAFSKEENT